MDTSTQEVVYNSPEAWLESARNGEDSWLLGAPSENSIEEFQPTGDHDKAIDDALITKDDLVVWQLESCVDRVVPLYAKLASIIHKDQLSQLFAEHSSKLRRAGEGYDKDAQTRMTEQTVCNLIKLLQSLSEQQTCQVSLEIPGVKVERGYVVDRQLLAALDV